MKKLVQVLATILLIAGVESYTKKDCICGIENSGYQSTLRKPVETKYAWLVALSTLQGEAFCSGALISDQLVLTARSYIIRE